VTAPLTEPRSAPSGFRLSLQRERALTALFDLGRQKSTSLRLAKLYAFGVFVSYAVAILLARGDSRSATIHGFVKAALVSLSWVVGGLSALGSAQALAQQTERDALAALALQRGFPPSALLRARTWAATVRVTHKVSTPALGGSLRWALAVAPAVVVYAGALGLALALLAHFSAELAPCRPRAFLAMLVLGPLLLSLAYPTIPSLPRLFSAFLARLLAVGAAFS
jgi:hypothetical protein